MRSELVNHLPIANSSKIFLRALIEQARSIAKTFSFFEAPTSFEEGCAEIMLDTSFDNSALRFTDGIEAFEELYKLNLVAILPTDKKKCRLHYKNLLKLIEDSLIESYSKTKFGSKQRHLINKDRLEIYELLQQLEQTT